MPVQCGDFAAAQLDTEAPVVRIHPPEVRQHADEPGERHRRRLGERLAETSVGREELAPEVEQVEQRSDQPRGGRPAQLARELQRLEHARGHVLGERHLGAALHVLPEHLEAVVRVDPPLPRRRDRHGPVERQPGGVREQVADGRPGRPRLLVEVDDALLRRDERRERRDQLRDRRPAQLARLVPVPCADAVRLDHPDRNVLGAPRLDLPQRVHAGDTRRVERRRISSGSPYEPIVGYSRAVVVGKHVFVGGTAPVMPDGAIRPTTRTRRRALPRDHPRRAREAGARPDDVVRTRIFTDHRSLRRGRARTREVFGEIRPASTAVVTEAARPPLARRDRGRGDTRVKQIYPASITGKSFAPGGSVLDHKFGKSDPYTLGVEEEYMLLDGETHDLVQHIDTVLAGDRRPRARGPHQRPS